MQEYHKINTIFKRDMTAKKHPIMLEQYSQPEFAYLTNNQWVGTEKIDGTNIRIEYDPATERVYYGGRTDNAQTPTFLLTKLEDLFGANRSTMDYLKESFDQGVMLIGEGFGRKIQKGGGKYIKDGVGFCLFDVNVGGWWLKREDVESVADHLNVPFAPRVFKGTLLEAAEVTARGFKSQWGDFTAEGLVLRPEIELKSRSGHRVITKIKYVDFEH